MCIPIIRHLHKPATYMLLYAAPVTRKMLHFNRLAYCALPSLPPNCKPSMWLTVELGMISGRLYFDFDEYESIKAFLGIVDDEVDSAKDLEGNEPNQTVNGSVAEDTAVEEPGHTAMQFTAKPVTFMHEYLTALRKDTDISSTPMDYVLTGKVLTPKHPFFSARKVEPLQKKAATRAHEVTQGSQEEEDQHDDELELLMAAEKVQAEPDCEDGEEWYKSRVGAESRQKEKVSEAVW